MSSANRPWPVTSQAWGCERSAASVVVVSFHGFGESAQSWEQVAAWVCAQSADWRWESIDLPGHGGCPWWAADERERLNPIPLSALREGLDAWLVDLPEGVRLELWAFSMGARVATEWWAYRPQLWHRVVLIAPDAFGQSAWYRIATGHALGRRLLTSLIDNPGWLWTLAHWAVRWGLVSRLLVRFAQFQMEHLGERQRLVWAWLGFRRWGIGGESAWTLICQKPAGFLQIVLGERDLVIKPNRYKALRRKWGNRVEWHILPTKHNDLLTDQAAHIGALVYRHPGQI